MNRTLIYIAGPYSSEIEEERDNNVFAAIEAGKRCWLKGWFPVIPHALTWGWEKDPRFEGTDWIEADFSILDRCHALCVIGNWEKSTGTLREIDRASENGLPVFFGPQNVPDSNLFVCDVPSMVVTDLLDRKRFGVSQYGKPLYPFNGRDTLQDVYEEALDLVQYLRTLNEEVARKA